MMTDEQRFANFGAWLVKGSDGWLAMLEKFTADGQKLNEKSLGELRTAFARIRAVIDAQDGMRA